MSYIASLSVEPMRYVLPCKVYNGLQQHVTFNNRFTSQLHWRNNQVAAICSDNYLNWFILCDVCNMIIKISIAIVD